ncbi:thioesterase family protein [Paraglaciecola sp. MB-3u-78]|uniref:acyl-CoA thioesterase n=1 Tax=Paraglaciecola sp. MB-3u-78 TaxID=2058332 RepID=UPI000C341996|nr:thioesterase family protein [Paraglaciecola sp. MB-3u-78]PKH00349.1 thioesterase [Paraglaciecola sp. MB-3u-78]
MSTESKTDFLFFFPITTRWMDNDMFGHVNNINYYSYFDTVVNQFLIEQAGFAPMTSAQIGFIVKSNCSYIRSVSYPEKLIGTFRVDRLGKSSVDYCVGIFKQDEDTASAVGCLTHVFVDRQTQKPTPIQGKMREAMVSAMVNA